MVGLLHIYNSHAEAMLTNISEEYNIELDPLKQKYLQQNEIDFNVFAPKKRARKKNKQVTKEDLCTARKAVTDVNAPDAKTMERIIAVNMSAILNLDELTIQTNIQIMINLFIVQLQLLTVKNIL